MAKHMPFLTDEPFCVIDYDDNIYTLCKMILQTVIEKNKNCDNIADMLLMAVFEYINKLIAGKVSSSLVNNIQHFLTENISNVNVDMALISKEIGYNKDYIRRLFKTETGITPLDYLTKLRISHAKRFLLSNVYNISTISTMCGFSDVYYFSRCFKKETGISPRNFRKNFMI